MEKNIKVLSYLLALSGVLYLVLDKIFVDASIDEISDNFSYETISPEIRNIVDSIGPYGAGKIKDEQKLTFSQSGKITGININVGQQVKKGTILGGVENTVAQNTVTDAQRNIKYARIGLSYLGDTKKWNLEMKRIAREIEKEKIELQNKTKNIERNTAEKEYKTAMLELEKVSLNYILEKK